MRLVSCAWLSDAPTSQFERLVLVFLASHCEGGRKLRVVPREVAPMLHCTPRKLDAALASLASTSVISAVRWDDTGAWTVTVRL